MRTQYPNDSFYEFSPQLTKEQYRAIGLNPDEIKETPRKKPDYRHMLILFLLLSAVLLSRMLPLWRNNLTDIETVGTMLSAREYIRHFPTVIMNESWWQLYFIAIPYAFLHAVGISTTITETLWVFKAALDLISAFAIYRIAIMIAGRRTAGYAVLILYAISPIAIFTGSLGFYTGDAITPMFLIIALYLLLYGYQKLIEIGKESVKAWLALAASAYMAYIAFADWSGGSYAMVSYLFAILSLLLYRLLNRRTALASAIGFLLIAVGFLYYLHSPYNAGIFCCSDYLGGAQYNAGWLLTDTNPSLYFQGLADGYEMPRFYYPLYQIIVYLASALAFSLPLAIGTWQGLKAKNPHILPVFMLALIAFPVSLTFQRFYSLSIIPLCIIAAIGLDALYHSRQQELIANGYKVLLLAVFLFSLIQIITAYQPQDMSSQNISALEWLRNNTPPNALILVHPRDSLEVEWYANRESYTGEWGGYWTANTTRSNAFIGFLGRQACNFTYLQAVNASYLVADSWWNSTDYTTGWNDSNSNLHLLLEGQSASCSGVQLVLVYSYDRTFYLHTFIYRIERD